VLPTNPLGPGDWWVFDIRGEGVTLEGLAIDGSVSCKPAATDPDVDTRMCVVPGNGSVLCKNLGDRPSCSLANGVYTVLGWFNGGDCIRSVGEVATPVDGISITE
jgi:hypothetical protein